MLAEIAALITVHRFHGVHGTTVTRGRRAGLAYLEQRAETICPDVALRCKAQRQGFQPATGLAKESEE